MKYSFDLGGEHFASKAAVLRRARAVRAENASGGLFPGDGFLRDLLDMHPDADDKKRRVL